MKQLLLYSLTVINFISCQKPKSVEQKADTNFTHQIISNGKPWTHQEFDNEKFSFAIFGDLTGGERAGVFDVAISQLNILRPDFIINVGDLIEGDHKSLAELESQFDNFDFRVKKAKAPVFYIGGNHDLTSAEMQNVWDKRYGKRYYHFIYKNALFLVLDSEDNTPKRTAEILELRNIAISRAKREGWGSFPETEYAQIPEQVGGNISKEQADYFVEVIKKYPSVTHTFLFVHKAPWKIDNPGFLAMENALEGKDYTVFNGHVHAYEYEQRLGKDYIRLATTGGVQFPEKGLSADHVTWVTVDENGVDVANLLLQGILNKKGVIPNGGDTLNFEKKIGSETF
ncbi:MAG: metallophosphoesterase family protein [Salibacteraceae bacterium]